MSSFKPWPAYLYLEKGGVYSGLGFGKSGQSGGEAVFNTGMSGYQEILTDPSYLQQIVVMTYPHIGNTGVNSKDTESKGLSLSGLVVREYCESPSNWRSESNLHDYLQKNGISGISEIPTREVTIRLRDEGAQRAVIFPEADLKGKTPEQMGKAILEQTPEMEGLELVSKVSTKTPYWFADTKTNTAGTVVVYDYGAKTNILRMVAERGFSVYVVPHAFPYQDVLSLNPKAIVLSNGPGDPAEVKDAVPQIQNILGKVPVLAICMGHQLLARSLDCHTYKLKFGHHGVNHPVQDLRTGKIIVTSQNHGFSVHEKDLLKAGLEVSHKSLNDHTIEGFVSNTHRCLSVQFHPESKPGPSDASYLFDNFLKGFVQ